jgi:hypothetical protein
MKNFIQIKDHRFRKSTIKMYLPWESKKLNVYFSTSRDRKELETFSFETEKERDETINMLDLELNV